MEAERTKPRLAPIDLALAAGLFSISSYLVVVAARSATEFFDSPSYGRSWWILGGAALLL